MRVEPPRDKTSGVGPLILVMLAMLAIALNIYQKITAGEYLELAIGAALALVMLAVVMLMLQYHRGSAA